MVKLFINAILSESRTEDSGICLTLSTQHSNQDCCHSDGNQSPPPSTPPLPSPPVFTSMKVSHECEEGNPPTQTAR